MAETKVGILFEVQDRATQGIKSIGSSLGGLQTSLKSNEKTFQDIGLASGIAFGAVAGVIYKSVEAAAEAAKVQAQLGAVLKSTGEAAGVTAEQAIALSKSLEHQTVFSDEAVLSAENLLLTFTNIKSNVFPQATEIVLNMSQALGQDLKSSAVQVGKALQDPILGVSALRRVGVNFSEAQQDVIKKLVDTGHAAEAQALIMKELGTEFGGSAAAAAQTFSGKMEQMKNRIDDLGEEIGNAFLPILQKIVEKIAPIVDKITEWIAQHPQLTAVILGTVLAVTGLTAAIAGLALATIAFEAVAWPIVGVVALIVLAIGSLVLAGYLLYKNWEDLGNLATEVWGAITAFLAETWASITTALTDAWNSIKEFLTTAWNDIKMVFEFAAALAVGAVIAIFQHFGIDIFAVFDGIKTVLKEAWDFISGIFEEEGKRISDSWNLYWGAIQTVFTAAWNVIKTVLTAAWEFIKVTFAKYTKPLTDAWSAMWASISGVSDGAANSIKSVFSGVINYIIGGINKVINAINSIAQSGSKVIGVSVPNLPTIPRLASGGIVTRPTLAMIGEGGESEAVIPLSRLGSLGGNGGGITINIQGGTYLSEEAALGIADQIYAVLNRNYKF